MTTITAEGALAMLAEAQDLIVRLRAVAARADSAFDGLAAGQDAVQPTRVQRVLMAVSTCAPLPELIDALDEAGRVLAGEIPPFEEDDQDPVLAAEVIIAMAVAGLLGECEEEE